VTRPPIWSTMTANFQVQREMHPSL
jgi:hypothetical protein